MVPALANSRPLLWLDEKFFSCRFRRVLVDLARAAQHGSTQLLSTLFVQTWARATNHFTSVLQLLTQYLTNIRYGDFHHAARSIPLVPGCDLWDQGWRPMSVLQMACLPMGTMSSSLSFLSVFSSLILSAEQVSRSSS